MVTINNNINILYDNYDKIFDYLKTNQISLYNDSVTIFIKTFLIIMHTDLENALKEINKMDKRKKKEKKNDPIIKTLANNNIKYISTYNLFLKINRHRNQLIHDNFFNIQLGFSLNDVWTHYKDIIEFFNYCYNELNNKKTQ